MLTLHHLEYSQSFRILWLLELLGADYSLKIYERDAKTSLAPKEYKALSPTGTAPVLTDGEVTLSETNTIIDYLLEKYPNNTIRSSRENPNHLQHLFWYHSSQGSLSPLLLMDTIFRVVQIKVPFIIRPILKLALGKVTQGFIMPRVKALLKKANADLAQSPWFGGENITAADVVLSYSMESVSHKGWLGEDYPHCQDWLERMREEAAFQKAREKDGRNSIVFAY